MASEGVDPARLPLSNEELNIVRQSQYELARGGSTSSRAASRASSQGMFRLDGNSLRALEGHFDHLLRHLEHQMQYLTHQTDIAVMNATSQSNDLMRDADAEIARLTLLNSQIDELELELDRIAHIRDIVRMTRKQLEEVDRELDHTQSSSSRRRDSRRDGRDGRDGRSSGRHHRH